ncbi:MAG TPA: PilZ domain-containing protein [Kofleriaceae bacterium]|nr:PilZ domain-containing protein [Kofleriaceae bacterium]
MLAALDSSAAPPLAAVIAYYDPTTDQSLINLRYDELALGPHRLEYVVEVALLAEIGMIQPAALSDLERRRFLTDRLARCTMRVDSARNAVGALTELIKRLRAQKHRHSNVNLKRREPRGDTSDPLPLIAAKGTRNDLRALVRDKTDNDLVHAPDKFPRPTTPHRHVVSRSSRAKTVVAADPSELDEVDVEVDAMLDEPPTELARASSPQFPAEMSTIYARYLRSGKWIPIRVGSLSLKGAALMTGALPRLHDHVDIALAYGGTRALVRGAVNKVSTMVEAATTGASTFSVAFELDTASRRQLTALLRAARAANVTIKPPPPRATQRFPVEWPICIGTIRGAIKGDALDVSASGLFVRPNISLDPGITLNFSVVLDDGGAPIAGRARVVRVIGESEAQACGLAQGYGFSIVDMTAYDRERWQAFIGRVERRAEKRVLIGASPARLGELQAALAGAGYAVTGGTDPGALVQLANADARPVDAALIDGNWLGGGASASWVENLFSARDVPCVTVNGDVRRARSAVDRLLQVTS